MCVHKSLSAKHFHGRGAGGPHEHKPSSAIGEVRREDFDTPESRLTFDFDTTKVPFNGGYLILHELPVKTYSEALMC